MNTLYIHIGYPKTGTTVLQNKVFANHPDLYYLGKSSILSTQLKCDFDEFIRDIIFKTNGGLIESSLLSSIQWNERKTYLLSEERIISSSLRFWRKDDLTVIPDPETNARKLYSLLKSYSIKPEIIITLRKQDELITSYYAEHYSDHYINYSSANTLDRYISKCIIDNYYSMEGIALDFNYIIDTYQQVFGKDNVHVMIYEMFNECPSDFLRNLSSLLEIDTEKTLQLIGTHRDNTRRDSENSWKTREQSMFSFFRLIKTKLIGRPLGLEKSALAKLLRKVRIRKTSSISMNEEDKAKISNLYSASNRQLDERMELGLKAYGYY